MFASLHFRRCTRLAVATFATAAFSACGDDPVEPEPEPDILSATLTVGSSTITWNATTGAVSGPLVVPAGTSTVTAAWKKADGSNETLVTSGEFDLRFTPTNPANLTWVTSGAFGGTLTTVGLTSGQTTTSKVSLFHKEEAHDELEFTITIQIQ